MKVLFTKHTPSVFVVDTPFQVLCAIAAIRQLEINDYKVIAIFPEGEIRNSQTRALLDRYNIKYKEVSISSKLLRYKYIICSFLHRKNQYKRLFLGDQRDYLTYFLGYNYISDCSDVIFLDDGSITISYLKGIISEPMPERQRNMIDRLNLLRNIECGHNYLTIYGDIESPNNRVQLLDLHYVINKMPSENQEAKDVYIVGTNVARYCDPMEIPQRLYIAKLGELMQELRKKYPEDNIFFISHGRETLDYGQRLCQQFGCIFKRPEMMVELELLKKPNPPRVIYGYTSTALFTLKKLFPATKVVNILYMITENNPFYKDYEMCSDYYQKNGIELVKESLS